MSTRRATREQLGQSTVEFAAASLVLVLILVGLIDFGRVFYFDIGLRGATREGARHGSWFDPASGTNLYLYDDAIKAAVDGILTKSGLPASQLQNPGTTCPDATDVNMVHNPPYNDAAFGSSAVDQPLLYICYDNTPGLDLTAAPSDNGYRARDLNIILTMRFASVTGIMQQQLGDRVHIVANTHMRIGGY